MTRHPPSDPCTTQPGSVLLALLLLLSVLALGTLLGQASAVPGGRERATQEALSHARDALLGFAASYSDAHPDRDEHRNMVFGYLPCPDANGDGIAELSCGITDKAEIGRLPWKTLKIPPLRDGAGECLWYAISGTAKYNPKTERLNWDTVGQLVVRDAGGNLLHGPSAHERPLAVVLAAGAALAGQASRVANTGNECGGGDAANYLEALDSHWSEQQYTGNLNLFLGSTETRRAGTSNDAAQWIVARDIFDRVKLRGDFAVDINTLVNVFAAYLNSLPPASLPSLAGNDKRIDSAAGDKLIEYLQVAKPTVLSGNITIERLQNLLKNWGDNLLYIGGPSGFSYTTSRGDSGCRALLFFAGERTAMQSRSTASERSDAKMYLENGNAEKLPASGNYIGTDDFVATNSSADIVRCITGAASSMPADNAPANAP